MSIPAQALPQGVIDLLGVPAAAAVGPNLRTQLSGIPAGVLGETLMYPGIPSVTATWTNGSARVSAAGLPMITQVSQGVSLTFIGVPLGPIQVVVPDTRVMAG